ncbi:MAG TPA: response regulator transcription factor [Anaerolineales bacterium]|nr:response regulator transcription factor [Anaerolineales bacterium]HLO34400.1 response regulator transcription factor [Anaerolineales bacterium]
MSTQPKSITVLIADDHEMTRKGIRAFLDQAPNIQVIGEAQNGNEIKRSVAKLHPDILLLDLIMPDFSPVELERWVRTNYPKTITLVLTSHDRDAYLASMMEAGAVGYLDKKLRAGQLVSAIQRAARGQFIFDKQQLERAQHWREDISSKWESLSHRECQVLQLLTEGRENKAIAAALGITLKTVEKHLENVYRKLGVTSRAEAIHWWVEKNA